MIINSSHELQDIYRKRIFDSSRQRYSFALKLLPFAMQDQCLIDIGGGAGEFTTLAREKRYQTVLVDGNRMSIEDELNRGFEARHCDLTQGLRLIETAYFDVAVILEVIEHIVTAEQLLLEIARVVKPGGVLILSTPNFGYIRDRLRYLVGNDVFCEGYHYRFYTKYKLLKMLNEAGFILEKTNSIGSALGVNFILRMLSLGHLRLGQFRSPVAIESWHCSTFVWKLRRSSI